MELQNHVAMQVLESDAVWRQAVMEVLDRKPGMRGKSSIIVDESIPHMATICVFYGENKNVSFLLLRTLYYKYNCSINNIYLSRIIFQIHYLRKISRISGYFNLNMNER
jgi:hypothetical protein